jgi:hypothetical protein
MFLLLSFVFSFTKSENRKAEKVLPRGKGRRFGTNGRGRW